MIFEEKKIILKNGITAVLKTPETNDAEQMLDCIIYATQIMSREVSIAMVLFMKN